MHTRGAAGKACHYECADERIMPGTWVHSRRSLQLRSQQWRPRSKHLIPVMLLYSKFMLLWCESCSADPGKRPCQLQCAVSSPSYYGDEKIRKDITCQHTELTLTIRHMRNVHLDEPIIWTWRYNTLAKLRGIKPAVRTQTILRTTMCMRLPWLSRMTFRRYGRGWPSSEPRWRMSQITTIPIYACYESKFWIKW